MMLGERSVIYFIKAGWVNICPDHKFELLPYTYGGTFTSTLFTLMIRETVATPAVTVL